jgi:hypothetical protein
MHAPTLPGPLNLQGKAPGLALGPPNKAIKSAARQVHPSSNPNRPPHHLDRRGVVHVCGAEGKGVEVLVRKAQGLQQARDAHLWGEGCVFVCVSTCE